MEVTKTVLIETIEGINSKIDEMIATIKDQQNKINTLEVQNADLQKSNKATLEQITEYIQELEQIRNHYVDSNNNTSR